MDSSVPLTHHDPKDLGLICLVKKRKIYFRILSDFRIQSSIFLKKRNLKIWKVLENSMDVDWSNDNTLFRMTNPETEDPEVIPITGPPT